MNAYETIVTKRDTREFLPDPVGEDDLRRVLQSGRMAGSAKNTQVNRVVVVTDPEVRQALAGCGRFTQWLPLAPALIVIAIPVDGGRMVDVGRMAQNMLLAAHALGLGSCPFTLQDQDCARELLGIPAEYEAPLGVGIGHPDLDGAGGRPSSPRVPLEEIVHRERW